MDLKKNIKKLWHLIWEENSVLSWTINIILAFIIVKFVIYPLLGIIFGTGFPVVAVVSCSMEHNEKIGQCDMQHIKFDKWYKTQKEIYNKLEITNEEFFSYRFANGFNKGDIMVLTGYGEVKEGDVIVFRGAAQEPIIHRVVKIGKNELGQETYQTKGDNNLWSRADEMDITEDRYIGKALLRIPYFGWVKLAFNGLVSF